jgi:branched-chain amino acid transport system ATP-binding protein
MARDSDRKKRSKQIRGDRTGTPDSALSVDEFAREAEKIAKKRPSKELIAKLAGNDPYLIIEELRAGYGKMEILHDFNLQVSRGQSLCLIGPNGAGKSTALHSIFGFTNIFSGKILVGDGHEKRDVSKLTSSQKLKTAGIAYILQDQSIFPGMTVEENLWMGGYLMDKPARAKETAEKIFDKYSLLAERRSHLAKILSGGERRMLEISRALVMEPEVLLIDEPSIGLEPRFIEMVFEILDDLQNNENKTIVMVEQNAKKGLDFADVGYVLVSGEIAMAGTGDDLLRDPEVGRLFLGG